ncbi:hypothetical protein D3C77_234720 [compost metagenome]
MNTDPDQQNGMDPDAPRSPLDPEEMLDNPDDDPLLNDNPDNDNPVKDVPDPGVEPGRVRE